MLHVYLGVELIHTFLCTHNACHTHTHTHTQIDDLAVLYYRREDNDVKYLDLDATIDELMSDFNLVCDK